MSAAVPTMSTRIFLIAHTPLASALRDCAMHVFPDCAQHVLVLDVQPDATPEDSLAQARQLLGGQEQGALLVLTDVFGATPSNIAQRVVEGRQARLVTGVNLPMLLRVLTYRDRDMQTLVKRAVAGACDGVLHVAHD